MADIIMIFSRIIFWIMAIVITFCRLAILAIPILIIVLLVKLIKRYSQK